MHLHGAVAVTQVETRELHPGRTVLLAGGVALVVAGVFAFKAWAESFE